MFSWRNGKIILEFRYKNKDEFLIFEVKRDTILERSSEWQREKERQRERNREIK